MKTKFSIFITAITLLFNVITAYAQDAKVYFKKDGVNVFESAIADIDSIIFMQVPNLVIPLNSSDPLLCSYTQGNKSISLYGSRDENGMPKQLEFVFIKNETDEIIMQIYLDEYERPIRFITEDNLLNCDYITDKKALITLITKEGSIYSGEMDVDIQKAKAGSTFPLRSENNTGRKCIIQVTNCGQPFDKGDVFVVATQPYPNNDDVLSRPFPAKNIGGGLYECIIPYRTGYYINPQGVCEWTKEKVIFFSERVCDFFSTPALCPAFGVGMGACVEITEILAILCMNDAKGIISIEEAFGEVICSYMSDKDYYLTDMKLSPRLAALPYSIIGESIIIAGDAPTIPNLSIKTFYDCDLTTPKLIISNVQRKSATATVYSLMGVIEEIGVCYSSSNSTPTKENGGTTVIQKTYGIGPLLNTSFSLINLMEGTKYYIRPFIKIVLMNEERYIYGDVQTFQTLKNEEDCIVINGVCWATRNVGEPGTFVENPEDYGGYYQWNRGTTDFLSYDNYYNSGYSNSDTWLPANDPSPLGYRVPTIWEIESLLDPTYVVRERIIQNDINGLRFIDKASGESIFLPATGVRDYSDGMLWDIGNTFYWSSNAGNSLISIGTSEYGGNNKSYILYYSGEGEGIANYVATQQAYRLNVRSCGVAQVRFQKADAYTMVTEMGVDSENETFAKCDFGTKAGISQYSEIPAGKHYPWWYHNDDKEYYYCLDDMIYDFKPGHKYTVICSDDGTYLTFSVTDDGTFSASPRLQQGDRGRAFVKRIKNSKPLSIYYKRSTAGVINF